MVGFWLRAIFVFCRWLSSRYSLTWQRTERVVASSHVSFYKGLIPFMKVPHLLPIYPPEALFPNSITCGIRISTYEVCMDTNIQYITMVFLHIAVFITTRYVTVINNPKLQWLKINFFSCHLPNMSILSPMEALQHFLLIPEDRPMELQHLEHLGS